MKTILAVEVFTAALTSGHSDRAVEIAKVMTKNAKGIAREIWGSWRNMCAGNNLPACPF